ncbi:hypothetical protein DICPUDRAFT_39962 [Dictyostelium purpureum]|uniref:Peptidase S28 family protein n=1 Tax=Dictyostelium purpureum TaxID=5786 RepID=F0ZXA4_DICPU|nr:uncharacterized protein DICPUDRAFT_39962 [Dictyostelium purpureum]EGC31420.1 hypothetical protein DICPUDRAFT_39962 [Dictyostelium purpureum]|eukprot:XP_003292053.1 hypothetical protein DICPUDRAFT_39962 [Dictyostelium purpureum]
MFKKYILFFFIVYLFGFIESFTPTSFFLKKPSVKNYNITQAAPIKLEYKLFNQKIDHYNFQHGNLTFKQRFFEYSNYYDGNGPIFFVFGPEQELKEDYINNRQYEEWAKTLNASIICLEHRYYGKSIFTDHLTTESLQYLNSDQAIADVAYFITWYKKENKIDDGKRWVGFGASYGGTIAAQFKIKYPHLIDIIVSSSGPVSPELNFFQYLEIVQNTIISEVQDGERCVENIRNATLEIEEIIKFGNHNLLKDKFRLCAPLENEKDFSLLEFTNSLVFMDTVQYYDSNKDKLQKICNILNNEFKSSLDNYIQIWLEVSYPNVKCINVNYKNHIEIWKERNVDHQSKAWLYQTCTEYGYFMTTESKNQPFGSLLNLQFYTDMCQDIFGIRNMIPNTKWANDQYGGFKINSESIKSILYINSSLDPWYPLSFTPNMEKNGINTLFIKGHSHCSDIYKSSNTSSNEIKNAHNSIFNFIQNNLDK